MVNKKNIQLPKELSSWWFQPHWKILVKLDHVSKKGMKIKHIWNHQPAMFCWNPEVALFLPLESVPILAPPTSVSQLLVVQRKQPGLVLIVHVDPNGSDPSTGFWWWVFSPNIALASWWLNQPIWKILVKLDHFPKFWGEKKNIWNHHLE